MDGRHRHQTCKGRMKDILYPALSLFFACIDLRSGESRRLEKWNTGPAEILTSNPRGALNDFFQPADNCATDEQFLAKSLPDGYGEIRLCSGCCARASDRVNDMYAGRNTRTRMKQDAEKSLERQCTGKRTRKPEQPCKPQDIDENTRRRANLLNSCGYEERRESSHMSFQGCGRRDEGCGAGTEGKRALVSSRFATCVAVESAFLVRPKSMSSLLASVFAPPTCGCVAHFLHQRACWKW